MFNAIKEKVTAIKNKVKEIKDKAVLKVTMAVNAIKGKCEGTMHNLASETGSISEYAIIIIIGVVLGGLLLVGLIALFNNVIMPSTEDKVTSMFGMG